MDSDGGGLGDVQERPRVLPVEAVHDVVAATDAPPHQPRLEGDGVAVGEPHDLAGPGQGEGCGVDPDAGQEGLGFGGIERHERGEHGEPWQSSGGAARGVASHATMWL